MHRAFGPFLCLFVVACVGTLTDNPPLDVGPRPDVRAEDSAMPDAGSADVGVDGGSLDAAPDVFDGGPDTSVDAGGPIPSTSFCDCSNDNPADDAQNFEMCTTLSPEGSGTYYETGRSERSPESTSSGAPHGELTEHTFDSSAIYGGLDVTWRYWVYVPAQYDPAEEAALFVLTDGNVYVSEGGNYNTTVVIDNLIDEGVMPVTVAVFVDPGVRGNDVRNRSHEYDRPNDDYVRFLLEELLPVAIGDLNITSDPSRRAIGGRSSGGVAAFSAGWFRPESFGLIYTALGSFVQLNQNEAGEWAEIYPVWIMAEERKPLRVTLLSGSNDENSRFGNWRTAHMAMTTALDCQGYTYVSGFGDTRHGDGQHVRARFGADMRWLWAESL